MESLEAVVMHNKVVSKFKEFRLCKMVRSRSTSGLTCSRVISVSMHAVVVSTSLRTPNVLTVSAHHAAIISKHAILLLIVCKSDMFSEGVSVFACHRLAASERIKSMELDSS